MGFNHWILIMIVFGLMACGVRGKPQPPLRPAEIGRGEPSYKKAAEELNLPTEDRTEEEDGSLVPPEAPE